MNDNKIFIWLTTLLLIAAGTHAQLKAGFIADKTGGCSPIAVMFTNTSTGASASAVYKWDFGNGNTAASFNAGALYQEEKLYTVTLTVQDGAQTSVKTQTVTVYAKPVVNDITVSPVKGCLPFNATFNVAATAGSGSFSSYFWDFGDGNTQQGSAVQQHTYSIQQKATVSLTVTNNFGCSNTLQKKEFVEIIPAINASFSASQTILCRETDAVQFNNTSYGPGTLSYLWDFGDGTSSTVKAPSHSFNKRGIYTVKLTVTSSEGCVISSTQAGYINVASFSSVFSAPALICKGSYVTFNSSSTPYTSNSSWEIDGTPVYSYSGYLNYLFNTTGTHTVKLKNIFGSCPDSAVQTVTVKDIPSPNGFVYDIAGNCGAPVKVNFNDTTTGAVQWEWRFGTYSNIVDAVTKAASYTYASDGNYYATLKVTNADGCSATTGKYVGIASPYVYITATGAPAKCGPFTMVFTANSTSQLSSYQWNFGDGTMSADKQPEHLFGAPGNYPVTLKYVTSNGCTQTVSYGNVHVYKQPTAEFSASSTTVCGNTPVYFNAAETSPDNSYYWFLGDNPAPVYAYSSGNLMHQYNYDSTYSVKLVVYNQGGCTDTVIKSNYLKILPPFPQIAAVINTCDATRGLVTFTQTSKKGETFSWDFGDGATAFLATDQPTISHLFTKTGSYNTVLTVTNGQCSLKTSVLTRVLLKQQPVFSLDRNEICFGERFGFQLNNIEHNPVEFSYQNSYNYVKWQYADGSDFSGDYSNAYYPNYWLTSTTGTANSSSKAATSIRVIFQSAGFGCNDTSNFVPVKFKGIAGGFKVLADKQCWRSPVVLMDTSTAIGSSQIIKWAWNFGDGGQQTDTKGGTVTHLYNYPGSYNVSLTITDAGGCSSTAFSTKNIEVNGPKAAFSTVASTTITLPVYFNNYTNNYNSNNTQYQWDFGDGAVAADFSPSHAYALPGNYTIRLVAINPASLCSDTVYQQIKVLNFAPAFSFSSSGVTGKCPPALVRFSNNSFNYTRVSWDFGDGVIADNLNYPSHVYEKPGKYFITLYVYGPAGLKATYLDSVSIQLPAASLQTDLSEICMDGKINLKASAGNTKTYLWDFGDGALLANADSAAQHSYHTPGKYTPAIILSDATGCAVLSALNESINVHSNPVINFSPARPVVCKGSSLQIQASGGLSYEWSPAAGLNDAGIAAPLAAPPNNTTYQVLVKDDIGCSSRADIAVMVAQPFSLHAPPNALLCTGSSIFLPVTGASTYKWINNTNGLSNTSSSNPLAAPLASTAYTVTGSDEYNCFTDTAHIAIKVVPLPSVLAGTSQEVQAGTPVQLTAQTDNDVIKWNWSPASYLNCTTCASPISTPMAQTMYTVAVTNKNGCTASDTVILKVHCEQVDVRIPNAFTPNNDNNNDVFMIKGISLVKHLVIFNRWGEKVFERSNFVAGDRSSCWNGIYKGNPQPEGSYVYYAEMQCPTGGAFMVKGSVILMR